MNVIGDRYIQRCGEDNEVVCGPKTLPGISIEHMRPHAQLQEQARVLYTCTHDYARHVHVYAGVFELRKRT